MNYQHFKDYELHHYNKTLYVYCLSNYMLLLEAMYVY